MIENFRAAEVFFCNFSGEMEAIKECGLIT